MKAGVHFARGSISVFRWVLLCYDIKATCEKIEIGAQHALSDKIIQSFFFPTAPIQSNPIPDGNCSYSEYIIKEPIPLHFFSVFFIVSRMLQEMLG